MEKLGINFAALLAQVFNFILVFWALRRFLLQPLLKLLQQREKKIKHGLQQAQEAEEKLAQLKSKIKKARAKIKQEREETLQETKKEAEKLRAEILAQARQEAQEKIKAALKELEKEKRQLQEQWRQEALEVALATAAKVLADSLGEKEHRALIARSLERFQKTITGGEGEENKE